MTTFMSCSISRTVMPWSRTFWISRISAAFSAGFMPAAGSSSISNAGFVPIARAISRRRWSP